ncbi:MAG: sulfite exporter TauE/SafE family protein [Clostridiales Family XIII bacterium]|nr:sulfite exporter TauE/SafE family protein [Clostridiales Family XIII bacterium]
MNLKHKELKIGGMTCVNCQKKIEKKLRAAAGVESATVSYAAGRAVLVYDPVRISVADIAALIGKLGYELLEDGRNAFNPARAAGVLIVILALYMLLRQFGLTSVSKNFPLAEAGMGYGMLFVIGLLTSVHCVAMCGGINLSQCIPQATDKPGGRENRKLRAFRPSFLYNLGRVLSYTLVGGIVGALGSAITFSGGMKGAVQLIAGVFMVIMGLNMLGVFPWLRRITPRLPGVFSRAAESKKNSGGPLVVGLLNGLMPCGPLQAMQLYALSTGDPLQGALSMLLFSAGTAPLMFGLGAAGSFLSKRFTSRAMTVGAVLVTVLGLGMFSNGWNLSGFSAAPPAPVQANNAVADVQSDLQVVNTSLASGRFEPITVQAGIPVKWVIDAPQGSINGCNNRMFIPEYDIEHQFKTGENVIEFVPEKTGTFMYSCWMGMIRSTITVI